jgi:hypothetical protein
MVDGGGFTYNAWVVPTINEVLVRSGLLGDDVAPRVRIAAP